MTLDLETTVPYTQNYRIHGKGDLKLKLIPSISTKLKIMINMN